MKARTAKRGDTLLFWLAMTISVVGLFYILDAGYAQSMRIGAGILPKPFTQQIVALIASVGAFFALRNVSPETWKRFAPWGIVIAFGLLFLVEKMGTTTNEATRWLKIGPVQIQPAEFMKVAAVLYLATTLAAKKDWDETWEQRKKDKTLEAAVVIPKLKRLWPGFVILFAWFMIEHEKDIGTASVVLMTAFTMFLSVPVTKKSKLIISAIMVIGLIGFVAKEPYRVSRFMVHPNRWQREHINDESYQTIHSELAMASGGVLGTGIGTGRAKHLIPATTSDFIMATVAEECGVWGPWLCLGLVGGISFRLLQLAQRTEDKFKKLFMNGVAWWIGIQACTNMLMANATIPAIGIPFPFVSAGGSSLLALWIAVAISDRFSWSTAAEAAEKEVANARRRNRRGNRRTRLSGT